MAVEPPSGEIHPATQLSAVSGIPPPQPPVCQIGHTDRGAVRYPSEP